MLAVATTAPVASATSSVSFGDVEDGNCIETISAGSSSLPIGATGTGTSNNTVNTVSTKKTLGGFIVKREEDDSDSEDGDSAQDDDDRISGTNLINNEMVSVMTSKVNHRHSFTTTNRASGPEGGDMGSGTDSRGLDGGDMNGNTVEVRETRTLEVSQMFGASAAKNLKPQHSALNRVVQHLFALDELSLLVKQSTRTSTDSKSQLSTLSRTLSDIVALSFVAAARKKVVPKVVHIISSTPFVTLFTFLTIYALFGPDVILLVGSKDLDDTFLTLHTIIFFLFVFEMLFLAIGMEGYSLSFALLLDFVALFSWLSDTWFLHDGSLDNNTWMFQARMARLARVARVARVTKLVPRMMARLRDRRTTALAKRLLARRLWRAFQYLDVEQAGLLSSFDLKCFYVAILRECSSMLSSEKGDLLKHDCDVLLASSPDGNLSAESQNVLSFHQFEKVFLSTALGHEVLMYHVSDIQHDRGVWTMAAKLTDASALKVCIIVVILIISLQFMEVGMSDTSAQQGLFHIYAMLKYEEKLHGLQDHSYACNAIRDFKADLDILFLFVDGRSWLDYGVSFCPANLNFSGDPFEHVDRIMNQAKLRSAEVIRACLPRSEKQECPKDKNVAVALVNRKDDFRADLAISALAIVIVIILMMLLVFVFSHQINTLSRTTLQPLRALTDDMTAISSVDLVHIDAETDADINKTRRIQELVHLHKSFVGMRGAIRSWSRYVPPSVVQMLFSAGKEATIGAVKVEASILFVDVDGFEDACSGMQPNDVNHLLATVFEKIALVIGNNRGTLLEFIGDEVLAVFNTPNMIRNHVFRAVSSALEIHALVGTLPQVYTQDGRVITLRCRCGIHTAHILAGNMGSFRRMKFGLLGDGVNLTARLKGLNSLYNTQTIASEKVFADEMSVRKAVFRPLDRVAVKGKTEPTTVYEVMSFSKGDDSQVYKDIAKKHTEAFTLYYERDFPEAKVLFAEVARELEQKPWRCRLMATAQDQPARRLSQKCSMNIRQPPGPEWDGVERLQQKTFKVVDDDGSDEVDDQFEVPAETVPSLGPSNVRVAVRCKGASESSACNASDETGTFIRGLI